MKLIVLLLMVIFVAGGWFFFTRGGGGGGFAPSGGYQPSGGDGSQSSQEQQNAAYDGKRKADLGIIKAALTVYKMDYEAYPSELSQLVGGGYLSSIPKDPKTGEDYSYQKTASDFTLTAILSDGTPYSEHE